MVVLAMVFPCHHERPMSAAAASRGVKRYPTHMLLRPLRASGREMAALATSISDHTMIQRRAGSSLDPCRSPASAGKASEIAARNRTGGIGTRG
jgi:hypothetical protein